MELETIYCGDSRGIPITRKLIGACVGAFLPHVVAMVTAVWRESTWLLWSESEGQTDAAVAMTTGRLAEGHVSRFSWQPHLEAWFIG
jgi:hypothetical protein